MSSELEPVIHIPPALAADPLWPVLQEALARYPALDEEWGTRAVVSGWNAGLRPLRALMVAGADLAALQSMVWVYMGYESATLDWRDVDPAVAAVVPARLAREWAVLPISRSGDVVRVAMATPGNLTMRDDLARRFPGCVIKVVVADRGAILANLSQVESRRVGVVEDALAAELTSTSVVSADDDSDVSDDSAVAKLFSSIVERALAQRASDVHIEPTEHDVRIRYRIDGVLHTTARHDARLGPPLTTRIKVISRLNVAERRIPQDGRIALALPGRAGKLDLRIATVPTSRGMEKTSVRLLGTDDVGTDLSNLGFSDHAYRSICDLTNQPNGVVLATGPTGSGKTTTLYSCLNLIATDERAIYTIEDPVEVRMDGITQLQVNPKAGLTFATALRSLLRTDPDVMLVGEIRDPETAETAMNAAETGHLVLSTLHTNSASAAPVRLTEMGVAPYLVCSGLQGVIAQRLIRRLCTHCKEPDPVSPDSVLWPGGRPEVVWRSHRGGCVHCSGTGYFGRLAVAEVLVVNDKLRSLIAERPHAQQLEEVARGLGMITLHEDALTKVAEGVTSLAEAGTLSRISEDARR
ncbi:MAG: GspE/PulE family protein [Acidimicrobiales bacterium]